MDGRERIHGGAVRTRHPLRRHGAHAQLAHHFLPGFGVRANIRVIQIGTEFIEHQAGGLGFFVMAGDAILIDQRHAAERAAACRRRDQAASEGKNPATAMLPSAYLQLYCQAAAKVQYDRSYVDALEGTFDRCAAGGHQLRGHQ